VNLSRPPTYWQSPLIDMLIVLCYYTIIPQPLTYRLAAGVGLSLASAGVLIFTKVGIPPLTLLIALAALVMANLLGLMVSTRLFNYRRNQYKALVDQQAAQAALEWLATTDSLTGVLNRRSFLAAAEQEMARYKRHGHVFSILILDLDRFKDINDTHGHQAGDLALRSFSDLISRIGRNCDTFGRLGGEEFGLLLPETGVPEACLAAERLRQQVQALEVRLAGVHMPLTFSGGLVQVTPADQTLDDVIRRADQALYRAKERGRNQIEVAGINTPTAD
jgi:diguanylate cyclase (GGDEF)-like protein